MRLLVKKAAWQRPLYAALILLTFACRVNAQWELDNTKSSLSFVSIKNNTVGEIHRFTELVGFIGADGKVQVGVDLDSVDTQIEIRNSRMRELLFEAAKFPAANITAEVDPAVLADLREGGTLSTEIDTTISLHGRQQKLSVPVMVSMESGGTLRVFTARPVLVKAADFDFLEGVAALQAIAGLSSISTAVPVTFHLLFVPAIE